MESYTDLTQVAVPRPSAFDNWDDMLAALPQLQELPPSSTYPRSALRRFRQRREVHGHHPPANKKPNGGIKRGKCAKCRHLLRKNRQLTHLVKSLQSMEPNRCTLIRPSILAEALIPLLNH